MKTNKRKKYRFNIKKVQWKKLICILISILVIYIAIHTNWLYISHLVQSFIEEMNTTEIINTDGVYETKNSINN